MDQMRVKTVSCEGSPFEIGLTHGNAAAAEVHINISTYTNFFGETAKITWAQAKQRACSSFLPILQEKYPDILEEMAGIAKGAGNGLTREDILTLNVRSEIALTNYTDGCTAISQKTNDGALFVGQNWDWIEELQKGMILLNVNSQRTGASMKFLGEAGIVGKIGMNSFGLGLCSNAIRSGGFDDSKFPVHIMTRRLLEYATSVDHAITILNEHGLASTTNYMLADKSGNHVDMECSPLGNIAIHPTDGYVIHTNHLYSSNRPAGMVDFPASNSLSRLARMRELTKSDRSNYTSTTFESLKARFEDRQGSPYSIYRTRPPGAKGMERMMTLSTIIMEMKQGSARIFLGGLGSESPDLAWSFSGYQGSV